MFTTIRDPLAPAASGGDGPTAGARPRPRPAAPSGGPVRAGAADPQRPYARGAPHLPQLGELPGRQPQRDSPAA
ncbi:hypothetical protein [Streptomyces sp. ADI95-16]|uniref:hypothetical protein n=1 Tax=Streptomyces sp. ADI95-16 TaxID=1522758 RepID=UPI0013DE1E60|nr:hypothetical protein [Streptomyces sp. ADI95-16]